MRRLGAALGALLLLALLPLGGTGCSGVGYAAGTLVDSSVNLVAWPFREGVFLGVYKYDNDPDLPWVTREDPKGRDYGDEIVAVAASGGGSRAAYFLACALDELRAIPAAAPEGATRSAHTLLDEVDFISSVSGGSLSSAYYVMKRPRTSDPAALDAFFEQYERDMQKNFEMRSIGRLFLLFRWMPYMATYYNRGHLLAGCWDGNFFDDATFADLPPPGRGTPTLLINAASYSTANKFVYSRVPTRWLNDSKAFAALNRNSTLWGSHSPEFTPFFASGFDRMNSDIGPFRLSYAVAASASVPGLLGPMVLKDGRADAGYETLGDGGLYDNYGLETALQAITRVLDEHPGKKARLIVVDGSGYFFTHTGFSKLGFADYLDRTNSVAWLRSGGFADAIYSIIPHFDPSARARGVSPFNPAASPYRNLKIQVLSMYQGIDRAAMTERTPGAYEAMDFVTGKAFLNAFSDFNSRVKGIGTRFKLDSDDAEVLRVQAKLAVHMTLAPTGTALYIEPPGEDAPRAPRGMPTATAAPKPPPEAPAAPPAAAPPRASQPRRKD